ncbi:fimbrial-like protein [Enterobacter asburiae]|jgi:type 1 fimbria pilin|uniref:fimbrial-like protein n=1 Tax=Enterobacter asburiae TaxID=61645 RepID=UPI00288B313A|nr:fimbrial-like protein [Enterobacter asburiae]WNI64991.1 fimbrial-like protein [Enterobacter asburiae]WNI66776.1 fimbrial-like protein [Enterobacter asburiae]
MQLSAFKLHQHGLILLIGLAGNTLPCISRADAGLDVNLTANIVNSTCKLSIENSGEIYLPNVMRSWFYNTDGSDRFTATDDAGGTPFKIHVDDCYGDNTSTAKKLNFSFSPQSGFWPGQNQVFKSEDNAAGSAKNVGVVVFSEKNKTNVLNSDGTSKVIYDVSGQGGAFLTDYQFFVRYQNIGAVAAGIVTSKVLVDVTYE